MTTPKRISPVQFRRLAFIPVALFFLFFYPAMLLWHQDKLPEQLAPWRFPDLPVDAPQWYLGAATAYSGDWENLYPELNHQLYDAPNHFRPWIETGLFRPEQASGNAAFYPIFACRAPLFLVNYYPTEWTSRYRADFWSRQHPRMQSSFFNFFYPPPTALMLAPFAWFSLEDFTLRVLPILCAWAMFGGAMLSGRIYRLLVGKDTFSEGVLILAFLAAPWADQFNCGNVSPILSCCLAWCVYAILKNHPFQTATAMIPALLTKGIPIFWMPLLLLGKKIRWKSIGALLLLTLGVNLAVLLCAGWDNTLALYTHFFREFMPHFGAVVGYEYITRIALYYGVYPALWYSVVKYLLFALLYWGFYRAMRQENGEARQAEVWCSVLGGTMCVYLIFNRLHWEHYYPFLFFFPFLAWIFYEVKRRSRIALALLLLSVPAILTTRLDAIFECTRLSLLSEALAAPLLAINPELAIWQFFLPRFRTLAFLAGVALALSRLYPGCLPVLPAKCIRRSILILLGVSLTYLAVGVGIRAYTERLADDAATREKAAAWGNRSALLQTAILLEPVDPAEAGRRYRIAAWLGESDAFLRLGKLYESGRLTPADPAQALRHYTQAALAGKAEAWAEVTRLMRFPQ